MTAAETTKPITKDQIPTLQHLSDLLHLFRHRNKNQHRRSTWYRRFSTFRRQVKALITDLNKLHTVPATHLERTRKKTQDFATNSRITERLRFWQDKLVPRWYHAFSQLVADGRFAVLGVVLIAILGQVCGITGVTQNFEDLGDAEVRAAVEGFGREIWGEESVVEDAGVPVERALLGPEKAAVAEGVAQGVGYNKPDGSPALHNPDAKRRDGNIGEPRKGNTSSGEAKVAQKKRKKGDAIDDLFSGLG